MSVRITVRVKPRSRPGLEVVENTLVLRVAAAPVAGRATEEAARALSAALGVPRSRLRLVRGERSPLKVFEVQGLSQEEADAGLARLAGAGRAPSGELPG